MKKTTTETLKRRTFLKGSAFAGAALGAGAGQAIAAQETEPVEKPLKKGYRETDHIREYYRRARF